MKFQNEFELYQIIGKNIKDYRKARELTQEQLADLSKISLSYLSKIEANGCNKSISISILNQIANTLDVDIKNFFKEVE